MLITVLGVSRLGRLTGLSAGDPSALLRLDEQAPTSHVLVLTPLHGESAAREQAHVLVSARPQVRVCVQPLAHHALTLSLLAHEALDQLDQSDQLDQAGPAVRDPSVVVQQIRMRASSSRSLVWYPRLGGLTESGVTPGQRTLDLLRRHGWFRELGSAPAVTSGRSAAPFGAGDVVHHLGAAPALLLSQLGQARRVEVPVEVEPAPYSSRTAVELTVLARVSPPIAALSRCSDCSAGLIADQCPFCGHGPVHIPEAAPLRPQTSPAVPPPAGYRPAAARLVSAGPLPDPRDRGVA